MCTVSWLHQPGGYQLFCNRDEKKTRQTAKPPTLKLSRGVRALAPEDGDTGGTWIAVNQHGVTLCLLNRNDPPRGAFRSRGFVVPMLMDAANQAEVGQRLTSLPLESFPGFSLLAVAPGRPACLWQWDGVSLETGVPGAPMVTSSSYQYAAVTMTRRTRFARVPRTQAGLLAFHESHGPAPGPHSVCMHRPDAQTVSLSWVRVTPALVEFLYYPDAPCQAALAERVTLIRGTALHDSSLACAIHTG